MSWRLSYQQQGLSMVELLVAMLLALLLLVGLVQIAVAARSSFRLQESVAELQERGRFAADSLGNILRQSTFTPRPWQVPAAAAGLLDNTQDTIRTHGDRLAFRTWSDRNCFGNANPVRDASGLPAFYMKEHVLELNGSANLAHTCRYGPDPGNYITQIQRQGLVQGVEAFQALYAEDSNGDGEADRWVRGAEWQNEPRVLGVQLALLLSSSEPVVEPREQTFTVLVDTVVSAADGKLRRLLTLAHAFRGRVE